MTVSAPRYGAILALALASLGGIACDARARAESVVVISIDTCRADRLGSYGYPRETSPVLDALAAEGVRFRSAQSTNPVTLPAHSSMLTGTLPPTHGVRNNESYRLDEANVTLAEMLRDRGYRTAAFVGSLPLAARFGLDQGFESYDDTFLEKAGRNLFNERSAEEVSTAAITWLEEQDDEPFFLFLHYFDPHAPYDPPEPYASTFTDDLYAGEIAYTDHWIGRVLDKMKERELYDSSIIVVTSDHGESLGEHGEESHGYFTYQSTIRVPFLVRAPGAAAGLVVDEPVSVIDIVPTVLGAIGAGIPEEIQGLDLGDRLGGASGTGDGRTIYSEAFLPASYGCSPLRSVTEGRWKYVWSVEPELYDLEDDPDESVNLVDREPAIRDRLHESLREIVASHRPVAGNGAIAPDPEELARLESLGYLGGGRVSDAFDLHPDMTDPKDFVSAYARLTQAVSDYEQRSYDRAEATCTELLREHPGLIRARAVLGSIALDQGRNEEAAGHFEEVLRIIAEQEASATTGLYPDREYHAAVTHMNLATLRRLEGDVAAAREHYGQALRIVPDHVPTLVGLGGLLEGQGDLQGAAVRFERAVRLAPNDTDARFGLAVVLAARREIDEAKEQFGRVLEIDPGHAEAHNNLGILLASEGDRDAAKRHFESALRARPEFANAHNSLGNILLNEGRLEEARSHYESALRIRPDYANARRSLARVNELLDKK